MFRQYKKVIDFLTRLHIISFMPRDIVVDFGTRYQKIGDGDWIVTDQEATTILGEPHIGAAQVKGENPLALAGSGSEPISSVGTVRRTTPLSLDEIADATARGLDPQGNYPGIAQVLRQNPDWQRASQAGPRRHRRS